MLDNISFALESMPWVFYFIVIFMGLSIGSFLNVVAYRLPMMMEQEWTEDCQNFLEIKSNKTKPATKFNLATPASACPNCQHKIRFWENIPILSYLFLKAKCSSCHQKISIQYPLVEVVTGIISLVVAIRFGVSWQTLAALVFVYSLIALTLIDLKKQLLPDTITLPLLWLGIFVNLFELFCDLKTSVIGAMAGYLALWSVYQLFKLIAKKEGMGFGDFKLLATIGAWTGFIYLPQVILVSSIVGSVVGISMVILGKTKKQQPIPFGPYLAIAGIIALLWGETINQSYLSFL